MIKYEIVKNSREIKNRRDIVQGCTTAQEFSYPLIVESYDDKDTALNELGKYKTSVDKIGRNYIVEEYYVEENEYNEECDWISGGDVWKFTEMPEFEE